MIEVDRSLEIEKLVHSRVLKSGKGPKAGWGKFQWVLTFGAYSEDKCVI